MPILDPNASPQRLPNALVNAPVLPEMLGAQEAAPDLGADPQPDVRRAPSPLEQNIANHQQQLQKIQWAQANPWGTANNHPGTIGKIAHVLSVAGNIAGNIVAPNVMANIPGTQLNRQAQGNALARELDQESNQESEEQNRNALTQKTQQEMTAAPQQQADKHALDTAQTAHLTAETDAAKNPAPKNEFELWRQQHPNGTAEQYNQLMSKPLSAEDAAARNAVWDTIADRYHLPKGQFRAGMSGADAGALATALNNVVGRDQGAQKIVIQNQTAQNGAAKTRDAETNKEYTAAAKDLNGQFSTAQTQAETLTTAQQELSSGAVGQAVGTIKTLVDLAGGKGTGVRITQAELNALAHARGIQGSFEGWLNGLEGKGQLAPEQLRSMQQLLGDVQGRIQQKMALQDKYLDQLSNAGSAQEVRQIQSQYRKEFLPGQGGGQNSGGGVIRARDPQGKLHEAPAGTPLPKGWKLDGQ